MEQRNLILGNCYNMIECWECEWNETKKTLPNGNKLESLARSQDINIRNALYGGRTEGFKRYFKCGTGVRAGHLDIVSLYPTVNALDDYPIGYGSYFPYSSVERFVQDLMSGTFFGIAKVDITPPKDLHVPVLPESIDGKIA